MMFGNVMYVRPGNLWKCFRVMKAVSVNDGGYLKRTYEDTGRVVDGVLAQATANDKERSKHLWDQDQHSLTHTLVMNQGCDLNRNDILALEEKAYLILAVDNIGYLGVAGLVYLEERNDIK